MEDYKKLAEENEILLQNKNLATFDRLNCILRLQKYNIFHSNEKAIYYCTLGIKECHKHQDYEGVFISKSNLSVIYSENREFDKALKLLLECKEFFETSNIYNAKYYSTLINVANIYLDLFDFNNAEKMLKVAYDYFNENKNYRLLINTLQTLNKSYLLRFQFHKIMKNSNIVLDILNSKNINDNLYSDETEYFRGITFVQIFEYYKGIKDFNKAFEYSAKALEILKKTNEIKSQISIFNDLSEIYFEKIDYDKSIEYIDKAIQLSLNNSNSFFLHTLYRRKYEIFLKTLKYKECIVYLEKYHSELHRQSLINVKKDTFEKSEITYKNLVNVYSSKINNSIKNIFESNYCIVIESSNNIIHKINISHIVYFEFKKGLTYIHTMNSGKLSTLESFRSIESKINNVKSEDHLFFSVFDRTCIINLFWLDCFDYKNKRITLDVFGQKYALNISVIKTRELKKLLLQKKI